jgi:hypothetical protein
VSVTGDGKELGDALDDAEYDRFEPGHGHV